MSELFKKSLAKFGPERAYPVPSLEFSRQFCLTFTNNNYENFSVVSRLLPKPLIPHFHAVYSFCRWADDLGDETGGGEKALEYLRWLQANALPSDFRSVGFYHQAVSYSRTII
jgi:phytoene/squalene synthetase